MYLLKATLCTYAAKERDILSVFWDLHDFSRVKLWITDWNTTKEIGVDICFIVMYKQGTKKTYGIWVRKSISKVIYETKVGIYERK